MNPTTSWDDWCCPHPECDEGRTYSDPDTVRSTCCDRGHEVRLTWHGGEVQARLRGHASRHCWRDTPWGFAVCLNCADKSRALRPPIWGCAGANALRSARP